MSPRLIVLADAALEPWRNGGGVTRELLAWPSADAWRVRVSVADIESDGPFSAFPGVQRWFAVLQGSGVELEIDGHVHRIGPADAPLKFEGTARTGCKLIEGPTRDLNLMLHDACGRMLCASAGVPWEPRSAHCALFTAVAGRCRHEGQEIAAPAHALLWFERAPQALAFTPDAPAAGTIGWWIAAETGHHTHEH